MPAATVLDAMAHQAQDYLAGGMDAVVAKPIQLDQLVAARKNEVASFVSKREQFQAEIQASQQRIETLQHEREQVNSQIADLEAQKEEQETDILTREENLKGQRHRLTELQQRRGTIEVELAQFPAKFGTGMGGSGKGRRLGIRSPRVTSPSPDLLVRADCAFHGVYAMELRSTQGQARSPSGLPIPVVRRLQALSESLSCLLLLLPLLLLPSRLLLPAHFQVASHRPPTILPSLLPVGLLPITGQFKAVPVSAMLV